MGGEALFASVDPQRWRRCVGNPVRMLQETPADRLEQLAGDAEFRARLDAVRAAVDEDRARPTADVPGPIAFFCAEYAVHRCLPIYSGGLGVLAGDILKQASDQALPMVAVGLHVPRGLLPSAHRRDRLAAGVLGAGRSRAPAAGARAR